MKKNIYLILLISFVLYQTLSCSMNCFFKQIDTISNPHSLAWINDETIVIANEEGCHLIDLQNGNQPTTLCTDSKTIHCTFDNNQKILLSKVCNTDKKLQFMIYDLTTKREILPRLSKNCFLPFVLNDKLFLTSHSTNNQQHTVIDTDNKEYALPINCDAIIPVASSGYDLLFTPVNTKDRPLTQQKWTLVDVESLTQPKIEEICPTFLKDNPKNVSTAFYSHDGTCICFQTVPYKNELVCQWYIYNFTSDRLSRPINCSNITISSNSSIAAYWSPIYKSVFFDIKLGQVICSLPFTMENLSDYVRLYFSPNGTQLAILAADKSFSYYQLFLLDVPIAALNPPSLWAAICPRLLLLKSYQHDHIKLLPNELLSLIMKKLASVFGYPVRA